MRTLTATALTWTAGPFYFYDLLIESNALNLHWSQQTTTAGGFLWDHRIWSISEIETAIPPGSGIGVVNTVVIEAIEDGTGQSLRAFWNGVGYLEGADILVSLLPAGENYVNKIKLFAGTIEHVMWANGLARLTAVDETLHRDVLLPKTTVTLEVFPHAPEQSVGRTLPVFYGQGMVGRLALAPLLMVDESQQLVFQAAEVPLAAMTAINGYGLWPAHTQRLRIGDGAVVQPGAGQVLLDAPITAKLFGGDGAELALSLSRQVGVLNGAGALDGITFPPATIRTDLNVLEGDGYGELGIKGTPTFPEGLNTLLVTLQQHRRAVESSTVVSGQLFVRIIQAQTNAVVQDNLLVTEAFRHVSAPRDITYTLKPIAVDVLHAPELLLRARRDGGTGPDTDTYQIGEMTALLRYQPDSPYEPLFLNGTTPTALFQGRADVTGAVTGIAGQVIQNPADVIRATVLLDMGILPDTVSFDAARTAYGAEVFDGGVGAGWSRETATAREVLESQVMQARAYLFPVGDGTLKLLRYDPAAPIRFAFTPAHIVCTFDEQGRPTSTLTVDLSRFELIANEVRVHYGWHPGDQKYAHVAFASPAGSNHGNIATGGILTDLCVDSFLRYGPLPPRVVDAYWISDRATAESVLTHLVTYGWSQHCVVQFESVFVGLMLEVTDMITLTHPELPTADSGQRFEILGVRYRFPREAPPTMLLTALRVTSQTVDAFALKDQVGTIWYLSVSRADELGTTRSTAGVPYAGLTWALLNPGTPPDYLTIVDTGSTTRYVSLVTTGGLTEWAIAAAPPAGTAYTDPVSLRGQQRQYRYTLGVAAQPLELQLTRTLVSGLDLAVVELFDLQEFGGVLWTFYVNRAATLQFYPAADPFPVPGTLHQRISPFPPPHYLRMLDELGGTQYIRIQTLGGYVGFTFSTVPPSGTAYITNEIFLRGVSLLTYRLTVRSIQTWQIEEVG